MQWVRCELPLPLLTPRQQRALTYMEVQEAQWEQALLPMVLSLWVAQRQFPALAPRRQIAAGVSGP